MAGDADVVRVTRNAGEERFEAELDGQLAFLTYAEEPGHLALLHTEVPDAFEGRGVGGRLVVTALEHARREDLSVIPFCAFAKAYIDRHPEYRELVREG